MKSIGALALTFVLAAFWVMVVSLVLWVAVPAVFLIAFTWPQALALTTLLFLARGVFK